MKRSRKQKRSLSYGTLEPKRLLAGNVRANVQGEHIYIRGDQQDNQIRIYADQGQIRVQGIAGTTINGRNAVAVGNSTSVSDSNRTTSEFSGGLRIHTGPGNDSIDISGVRLNGFSIIYGGSGDDQVDISSTEFFNTAIVQTFTGDDTIEISDSVVTDTLFAITLEGEDDVTIEDSETLGSVIVATGDDNDSLKLESNQHLGTPQLFLTQDGDDTVEILNPNVGTGGLEIYTGNGDDLVTGQLTTANIDSRIVIAGQANTDELDMTIGNGVSNQVSLRGFEFDNEVVFQNARTVDYGFATFSKPDDSFFVADFVEFERTTRIGSIEWLGSYENSNAPLGGDNFFVEIYEGGFVNDENIGTYQAPVGAPIATFNIGNDANRFDTGLTWSNFGPTRKIFSYSADIDFTMSPNKQYWISIYSDGSNLQGIDANNDYYTLVEDIEDQLDNSYNGAANVKWPTVRDWYPNTSGKTHFTLRS